jgi:hypothetical protein
MLEGTGNGDRMAVPIEQPDPQLPVPVLNNFVPVGHGYPPRFLCNLNR